MKRKITLLIGALVLAQWAVYAVPQIEAAIPVVDAVNINQTALVYGQALQTAINTATQIANQVQNLEKASAEALLANQAGITTGNESVIATAEQAQGLLKQGETALQSWEKVFNSAVDYGIGSETTKVAYQQNVLHYLDQTYQDALRVAKNNQQQLAGDQDNLKLMLQESQNAPGNLSALQAQTAVQAQGVKQQMMLNQTIAALLAEQAADANYKRAADNAALLESNRLRAKWAEEQPAEQVSVKRGWIK